MSNHAPMTIEALNNLGKPEFISNWLSSYSKEFKKPNPSNLEITNQIYKSALGQNDRYPDWVKFFEKEIEKKSWKNILNDWISILMPGVCSDATHGIIRVGHATRSLSLKETPPRKKEFIHSIAYWASTFQKLPTSDSKVSSNLYPKEAILKVVPVPKEKRVFKGTIVSSLEALDDYKEFEDVINLINVNKPYEKFLSELTETFANVFLTNAVDFLTTIVFIHGVTSLVAIRNILPFIEEEKAKELIRYGWQSSCSLYVAFSTNSPIPKEIIPQEVNFEELIDKIIHVKDEHGIKFTEACKREFELNPVIVFPLAVKKALDIL